MEPQVVSASRGCCRTSARKGITYPKLYFPNDRKSFRRSKYELRLDRGLCA